MSRSASQAKLARRRLHSRAHADLQRQFSEGEDECGRRRPNGPFWTGHLPCARGRPCRTSRQSRDRPRPRTGEPKSRRLAEALRANLARRKAQKRARSGAGERDKPRMSRQAWTVFSCTAASGSWLDPDFGREDACLTLMPAALLTDEPVTLTNAPRLSDIRTMTSLLQSLGSEVATSAGPRAGIGAETISNHTRRLRYRAQDARVDPGARADAGPRRPCHRVAAGRLRDR